MKKALLVIDMQNVCVGEKHAAYFKYNNRELIRKGNKIIDANEKNLVVYIQNVMKRNFVNKFMPFQSYVGTEEAELAEGLHVVSDHRCIKYKSDAFTNPELDALLKKHEIECVEVIGVDGGACVSRTALGAIDAGYKVIVNENGIGTMFCKKRDKYFEKLQQAGARNVLVSMGAKGAVLLTEEGQILEKDAPGGTLVNSVGAGDSMVAGFLAGYERYKDYEKALWYGLCAGSASACGEGLATGAQVEKMLAEKI